MASTTARPDLDHPVFVQPGQGTQRVGMGRWMFDSSPGARGVLDRVARATGIDLARVMARGPAAQLDDTRCAQPAIFATNLAAAEVLRSRGVTPIAVAGHSSGELSALVTAGVVELDAAARLIARRASLMASVTAEGAMGLITGLDTSVVAGLCDELSTRGPIVVGLENAPGQVVVSGARSAVGACLARAQEVGARQVRPLRTSNGFHSPLMGECRERWAAAVEATDFQSPRIPLVTNDGHLYDQPDDLRRAVTGSLTEPVRWTRVTAQLRALGPSAVVECGDSRYLVSLVRATDRKMPTLTMDAARQIPREVAPA
jgi:[acyl-carrier-protein] S-malonyltransferase